MAKTRSIFDVIGPVMIGPSSSHTAGAVRLGALARAVFGGTPARATISLHGSFASTGRGHGTELAIVAGLLGLPVDDDRLVTSFDLAREAGMKFEFTMIEFDDVHPNTALFTLEGLLDKGSTEEDTADDTLSVRGSSIGGGAVAVDRIGDYEVDLRGDFPSLVVRYTDQPGQISRISSVFSDAKINIATMRVSRERRGADALMVIESDTPVDATTLRRVLKQTGVFEARIVPKI